MKKQIIFIIFIFLSYRCEKILNYAPVFSNVSINQVTKADTLRINLQKDPILHISFDLKDEIGLDTYIICIYEVPLVITKIFARDHAFDHQKDCQAAKDKEKIYGSKSHRQNDFIIDLGKIKYLKTGLYHCVPTAINLYGAQSEYHQPFWIQNEEE